MGERITNSVAISVALLFVAAGFLSLSFPIASAQTRPSFLAKLTIIADDYEGFTATNGQGAYKYTVTGDDDLQWVSSGEVTINQTGYVSGVLPSEFPVTASLSVGCSLSLSATFQASIQGIINSMGEGSLTISGTNLVPGGVSGTVFAYDNYTTGAGHCAAVPNNPISASYLLPFGVLNSTLLSGVKIPSVAGSSFVRHLLFSFGSSSGGQAIFDLTLVITTLGTLPSTGTDSQGSIAVGASIGSPNSVTLSDGSSVDLPTGTLAWNSPGSFTLNCAGNCLSDFFNFLEHSEPTTVDVSCGTGPCVAVTAVRGSNFSISTTSGDATVTVYDGVVQVAAASSGSSVILSGLQGTYDQKVAVYSNESLPGLTTSVSTAFTPNPSPCPSSAVSVGSGQPISGNLTGTKGVLFCVAPKGTTTIQVVIPPSLQNTRAQYSLVGNSSALSAVADGETTSGGQVRGNMTTTGLPTALPITLASPSGNDLVTITVSNGGSSEAKGLLQLQFMPSASNNTTTSSTLSTASSSVVSSTTATSQSIQTTTTSSSGGGGVPEFPYQLLAGSIFTILVIASYLLFRRHGSFGGRIDTLSR